jgi:hypothetical protein
MSGRFMRFALGPRCGCVVVTVTRDCRFVRFRRRGLRRSHFGRPLRRAAFACTTTAAAPSTPASTAAAATAAFGALGAAF